MTAPLGPVADRPAVRQALDLLDRPGSRAQLPTPALVVDVDAMEHNLAAAQAIASSAGVALRPHAKTHKSAEVARRQLQAGAVGVCVAKLAEAESLARADLTDLLVTSPVHEGLVSRVAALCATGLQLAVVVDDDSVVRPLAREVSRVGGGVVLDVLVDVDVGMHRTGVPSAGAALALARALAAQPALRLRGMQGYGGHWQHVPDLGQRRGLVREGMDRLQECAAALESDGLGVATLTGGGTGTFRTDLELGVLNELQPGSYAFMDREYTEALGEEAATWRQALFVQATVVSAHHDGYVSIDAGLKALATDAGPPRAPYGEYLWFGDEHGLLTTPDGQRPRVGDRVELVPPHCDPTVDRYDVLHLVSGDVLVGVVPVDARGQSQ